MNSRIFSHLAQHTGKMHDVEKYKLETEGELSITQNIDLDKTAQKTAFSSKSSNSRPNRNTQFNQTYSIFTCAQSHFDRE